MFTNIIAASILQLLRIYLNSLGQVGPPRLSPAGWGLSVCLILLFVIYSWNHATPIKRIKQTLCISVLGLACLKSLTLFLWPQTSPPNPTIALSLNNMITYWPLVLTQAVNVFIAQLLTCLVTITVFMSKRARIHAFWIIPAYTLLTGRARIIVAWAQKMGLSCSSVYSATSHTGCILMLVGLTLAMVMIILKSIHESEHTQDSQHKRLRALIRSPNIFKAITVLTTMDMCLSSSLLNRVLIYFTQSGWSYYSRLIDIYQQSTQWLTLVALLILLVGLAVSFIVLYRKTQTESQRLKAFTHFTLSLIIIVNIGVCIQFVLLDTHAHELTTNILYRSLALVRPITSYLAIPIAFYFILPQTSYPQYVATYFIVGYGKLIMLWLMRDVSRSIIVVSLMVFTHDKAILENIMAITNVTLLSLSIYLFYLSSKQREPINLPE